MPAAVRTPSRVRGRSAHSYGVLTFGGSTCAPEWKLAGKEKLVSALHQVNSCIWFFFPIFCLNLEFCLLLEFVETLGAMPLGANDNFSVPQFPHL